MEDLPYLERDDIRAAVAFARSLPSNADPAEAERARRIVLRARCVFSSVRERYSPSPMNAFTAPKMPAWRASAQ